MFVAYFKLKTLVQRLLHDLRWIREFPLRHPGRELEKNALRESVDYILQNMPRALVARTVREVLDLAVSEITVAGHCIEFGVFKGATIRYLAKTIGPRVIHGFDSFEGLPERWSDGEALYPRGAFNLRGRLPRVPGNVRLHKGLFADTLPSWLKANDGPVAFIHVDCDLYSSTKCIFDNLGHRLTVGTVIVFDEYFNYHNWKHHEYRAFQEWVGARRVQYEYLCFATNQVAVKISEIGDLQPNPEAGAARERTLTVSDHVRQGSHAVTPASQWQEAPRISQVQHVQRSWSDYALERPVLPGPERDQDETCGGFGGRAQTLL